MLFYSYEFVLVFLPVVLAAFFALARFSRRIAAAWLAVASLVFYGFSNPRLVLLILASITFNYVMASRIAQRRNASVDRWLLIATIAGNLGLLCYFKYVNFFIATANDIVGVGWSLTDIALPLGISVFTFTQIAFATDVYRGVVREYSYIHYLLFVTWFPHLIAGPILHHAQIMPQFDDPATYRVRAENLAIGLTIFAIGLAKKILLASSFAEYADPLFTATEEGSRPGAIVAWIGSIAYAFQIYFDFSGYTDMAIGVSRCFGVVLPESFNSPYRATSIIDFWRRWNITLSHFLRDYLYVPLGGNRRGPLRRHANLLATMLLGGLWHGANWTFVVWGGLHGIYLIVNHLWRNSALRDSIAKGRRAGKFSRLAATALTFAAVVLAWIFFRAESLHSAFHIIASLAGFGHDKFPAALATDLHAVLRFYWFPPDSLAYVTLLFGVGAAVAWLAPNTRSIIGRLQARISANSFLVIGAMTFWILLLTIINASLNAADFIYFNF